MKNQFGGTFILVALVMIGGCSTNASSPPSSSSNIKQSPAVPEVDPQRPNEYTEESIRKLEKERGVINSTETGELVETRLPYIYQLPAHVVFLGGEPKWRPEVGFIWIGDACAPSKGSQRYCCG